MRLFFAIVITAFAASVQATDDLPTGEQLRKSDAEEEHICSIVQRLAQSVMSARLNGMPLSDALKSNIKSPIYKRMVLDAYDYPSITTESLKDHAIREHGNKYALECYRAEQS